MELTRFPMKLFISSHAVRADWDQNLSRVFQYSWPILVADSGRGAAAPPPRILIDFVSQFVSEYFKIRLR